MHIHISPHDGVPIYRQITNQVKFQVAAQRLKSGDELPSIRQLAERLLVNPNTVARAYRELESAGVVVSRRGSGTCVADNGSPLRRAEKMKILADRAAGLVAEARQLGVDVDDVVKLVQRKNEDIDMPEPRKRSKR